LAGGCFASGYHWGAGVGKHRLPTDDMAWGVVDPNTFGTDEYVHLCRLLEWQPYICNNAGNGTVAEMKSWVEYCNARQGKYADERVSNGHPQPWDVRIWSIGNENWGPLPDGRYAAIVLAGDSPEAFNDIEHPDRVVPEATQIDCVRGTLTLPAHSLSIVKYATP
jgi:alpha-L-arabinofuranosidase